MDGGVKGEDVKDVEHEIVTEDWQDWQDNGEERKMDWVQMTHESVKTETKTKPKTETKNSNTNKVGPHLLAHKSHWQLLQGRSKLFLLNNLSLQLSIEDLKDILLRFQKEWLSSFYSLHNDYNISIPI